MKKFIYISIVIAVLLFALFEWLRHPLPVTKGTHTISGLSKQVDIYTDNKAQVEDILKSELLYHLDQLDADAKVMLKLTLPDTNDLYFKCVEHPNVLRVLALSGGYPREEANKRLAEQKGVVASFSRALTEGLNFQQSDEEFNAKLKSSIRSIVEASNT